MSILYDTIQHLCSVNGISGYRLCKDTGISPNILTELKMGRREGISTKNLESISKYFNVSVDYLLGNESKKEKATAAVDDCLTARKKLIAEKIMKLSEEDFERYESIIDKILS